MHRTKTMKKYLLFKVINGGYLTNGEIVSDQYGQKV